MKMKHALLAITIALLVTLAFGIRWRVSEQALYSSGVSGASYTRDEQLAFFGLPLYCKRSQVEANGRVTLIESKGASGCRPSSQG
jgi:hypothetical protein